MVKKLLTVFALLAAQPFAVAQAVPANGLGITLERNVAMKTRDGVTLRADVYRPAGEGTFPVLLQRTPYDKTNAADFALRAVARGYMVVVQDVRGRYTSEGEWYTFKHESEDGYDTVEWAAGLPHANGKVGMFGGSYVGATQMLAAVAHPPHLAGICPIVTASNYHENWTYQGGAFEQWFNESWTAGLAQDTLNRRVREATNAVVGEKALPLTEFPLFNAAMQVGEAGLSRTLAPYYQDWLAHPTYDGYWKQWAIDEDYSRIQVPALTIAAWYDIFQGGSLRNFVGLQEHAGNEEARAGQRLIVVIGGHSGIGRHIGAVDFGPNAEYDEDGLVLDWYDHLLLGKRNQFDTGNPVRIFVMGENQWRDEPGWPLARAKATRYLLRSQLEANGPGAHGLLYTDADARVAGNATDTFTYDPANPVPTTGGPLCCDGGHLAAGPQDQTAVETRRDVLVYSTDVLERDTEVTGPVTLDLFAATTAVDTDFTAKLVDVWPNGFVQNLTEGIVRARYRKGTKAEPEAVTPGEIYEYTIDLWSTSNVFLKGHTIRLEISSSNFPRFDRNLNTGLSGATSGAFVKATNTVYHDAVHPSALILPVVR
jgi:hypothetical protein